MGRSLAPASGRGGRRSARRGKQPSRRLRKLDASFREWRFLGKATLRDYLEITGLSVAGVVAGVGAWIHFAWPPQRPYQAYGLYLFAAGLVTCIAYALFGRGAPKTIRVGDLGLGLETRSGIARASWFQVDRIVFDGSMLNIHAEPLSNPSLHLSSHRSAVAKLVTEAIQRIPRRVEIDDEMLELIGRPSKLDGERVAADPPQVTGQHCRASQVALAIETEARLCTRCGSLYHHKRVPVRCVECRAVLKE